MEELYNPWAKIRINDKGIRQLIEIAMAPSKLVLIRLTDEHREALSAQYLNIVDNALELPLVRHHNRSIRRRELCLVPIMQ